MSTDPQTVSNVPSLPTRAADAHKGSVGRIVVVGGRLDAVGMIGAPALAANAAFRSGAGLVQIITPAVAQVAVATLAPCATTRQLPHHALRLTELADQFAADVVAIGPGLSEEIGANAMTALLRTFAGDVVIDADGLNLLATMGKWSAAKPRSLVLTPHPGEMQRLLAGRSLAVDTNDRQGAALALARNCHAVVVHKGAGTVVTDGKRVFVNTTGNAAMATGGAGDVLTGIIAALLGQKMSAFDAAVLGVHAHGLAGDLAMEKLCSLSVTATDLITYLPDAWRRLG